MIIGPFGIVDNGCTAMQSLMDFLNNFIRLASDNHSLHPLLLGKDSICHSTRNKNGNHRIEGILPTKGHPCYQHDGPIDDERNFTDVLARSLSNGQTDNIGSPTGDIIPKGKTNPCPHNYTPKQGVHDRVIGERNYWDKLDKEGTHGHRDKGENGKLMANLIPGNDH